jgi:hypothetical protein
MKIIPYKNKHIVNSLDYLNDKNIAENYQMKLHAQLNQFVISKQTPHINLHVARYYTNLAFFTDLQKNGVILQNDSKYEQFIESWNRKELCENALVIISENCDRGDLLDFIRKHYNKFEAIHWKVIFFQVISTLSIIQSKFPSFRHNNLKSNEIFVTKVSIKRGTYTYRVQNLTYKVPNIGYQIKFDNFDWANMEDLENPKLDEKWVHTISVIKDQNRYYDMHYFFNTLIQKGFIGGFMSDSSIPVEVKEFIKRIVPDKYRGLDKANVHERGRLIPNDEYLIPNDVLKNDPYFAEFRKN